MKWTSHPAVAAGGLSCLCCVGWGAPLINPAHDLIYHDRWAAASVLLPVAINMALLWLLFWTVLWLATRFHRVGVPVWTGLILFIPWLLLKDAVHLFGWRLSHSISVAMFALSGLCWIGAIVLWRSSFLPVFARARHFSSHMLGVAAFGALLVMGELFWSLWDARALRSLPVLHASARLGATGLRGQRPRIVWIILDELSYQQVYERRFPSLALPAFDQLAGESTVFTHVAPAASYTELAVPSMMTGQPVDRIRANRDGTLGLLRDPATGRWSPFRAQDTVFQDALGHDYRTGVAGWYNPYCRILSEVLDRCQWTFREEVGRGMFSDASVRTNVVSFWRSMLRLSGSDSEMAAKAHIDDYQDIVAAGDRILQDSSVDFLLLHIPVPHPGGIYDRRTRSFTTHKASYIDNLALADRYLAHVHQVLEQRGEWDSSAVVVMGDHSWRTELLWVGSPVWTAEDEAASHGGQFDDRPAYIVKLPHQTESARIDGSFPAVRTRALLDGILDGSIGSPGELAAFAGQPPPRGAPPVAVATRAADAGLRSPGR